MKTLAITIFLSAKLVAALAAQPEGSTPSTAAGSPTEQSTNVLSPQSALSLSALLQEILNRNPSLSAGRLRWEAQQERPKIVSALPDPMLTYGYWFQNVETRVGAMNQRVSASQKIPFSGKLSLAAERARKEALIVMWEYHALERDLVLRAKQAYFDLSRIDRSGRILQEQLDLLSPIISTAQARYQAGQVVQADVLKAQLALNTVQNRLLDLIAQREAVTSRVNLLRDRSADVELGAVELPPLPVLPPREAAYGTAQRYRQELRQAGMAIERDLAALALAKKEKWPDFTVGIDYTQIHENIFSRPSDNGQDAVAGFVSINIPLWFKKWKAHEREAEKRLAASQAAEQNLVNTTFAEVREAWFQAQILQDQVTLYETSLLPQAEQTFAASQAAYESGNVSFIDLLDSERALLTLRLGFVMAETELAKALARLERVVGIDLETVTSGPEPEKER